MEPYYKHTSLMSILRSNNLSEITYPINLSQIILYPKIMHSLPYPKFGTHDRVINNS